MPYMGFSRASHSVGKDRRILLELTNDFKTYHTLVDLLKSADQLILRKIRGLLV
jgi:hypothetical protein